MKKVILFTQKKCFKFNKGKFESNANIYQDIKVLNIHINFDLYVQDKKPVKPHSICFQKTSQYLLSISNVFLQK